MLIVVKWLSHPTRDSPSTGRGVFRTTLRQTAPWHLSACSDMFALKDAVLGIMAERTANQTRVSVMAGRLATKRWRPLEIQLAPAIAAFFKNNADESFHRRTAPLVRLTLEDLEAMRASDLLSTLSIPVVVFGFESTERCTTSPRWTTKPGSDYTAGSL